MKFIYIDESGDPGANEKSSPYYILSGLIIDSTNWKEFYNQIEDFRRKTYQKFGADFGEFKGAELFMHQGSAFKLQLSAVDGQWLYDGLIELLFDHKVSQIIVAQSKAAFRASYQMMKKPKALTKELRLIVWSRFLDEFEHTLKEESRHIGASSTGLVYFDGPRDKHVTSIVNRYARKYDSAERNSGAGIVESPIFVDSKSSKLIQLADVQAYSANYILRAVPPESTIRLSNQIVNQLRSQIIYPLK